MPSRARALAPAFDGLCLVAFVVIGRDSHGIGSGPGWFFTVLWPFAVGWFSVALAVRLYGSASRPWLRLTVTWIAGLALALLLRAVITERESLSTFTIVVYAFIGLTTFGWRGVAVAVGRFRPAARSSAR